MRRRKMCPLSPSLPLLFVSLLCGSSWQTSTAQICPNGTYQQPATSETTAGANPPETTGAAPAATAAAPTCIRCNFTIDACFICHVNETDGVLCSECFEGHVVTNGGHNCTTTSKSSSNNISIIIGAVVGSVLVVVAVVILVVWLIRNDKCPPVIFNSSSTPPVLPDPENLGSSFKDYQQSGSGQGRDHRYTKEPGGTPPRVQSVQYDGVTGVTLDVSGSRGTYINASGLPSPAPGSSQGSTRPQGQTSDHHHDDDDDDDGPVYINQETDDDLYTNDPAVFSPAVASAPAARPSKGPGPAKPKPKPKLSGPATKPKTKPTGANAGAPGVVVIGDRGSVFPPEDTPEQVYSNQTDSSDDDDYVNTDDNQPKR